MTRIALYDLDRTITRRPTYTLFLIHAAATHQLWRLILVPFVFVTIFLYAARLIGRARLKEINQALLLGHRTPADVVTRIAARFADRTLATNVLTGALAQIAADRAEGCRLVLATASYRFYAEAIAARLGFDDVIATDVATDPDGTLHARIIGENCYGAAKLRKVAAWLGAARLVRGECDIRFYSDHVSDAPVFDWADHAIAANPHAPLRAMAVARGWRVVDWD